MIEKLSDGCEVLRATNNTDRPIGVVELRRFANDCTYADYCMIKLSKKRGGGYIEVAVTGWKQGLEVVVFGTTERTIIPTMDIAAIERHVH